MNQTTTLMPETYSNEMAEELMGFINQYPDFKNCTIETHDDDKVRKDGLLFSRSSAINLEKLYELNKK